MNRKFATILGLCAIATKAAAVTQETLDSTLMTPSALADEYAKYQEYQQFARVQDADNENDDIPLNHDTSKIGIFSDPILQDAGIDTANPELKNTMYNPDAGIWYKGGRDTGASIPDDQDNNNVPVTNNDSPSQGRGGNGNAWNTKGRDAASADKNDAPVNKGDNNNNAWNTKGKDNNNAPSKNNGDSNQDKGTPAKNDNNGWKNQDGNDKGTPAKNDNQNHDGTGMNNGKGGASRPERDPKTDKNNGTPSKNDDKGKGDHNGNGGASRPDRDPKTDKNNGTPSKNGDTGKGRGDRDDTSMNNGNGGASRPDKDPKTDKNNGTPSKNDDTGKGKGDHNPGKDDTPVNNGGDKGKVPTKNNDKGWNNKDKDHGRDNAPVKPHYGGDDDFKGHGKDRKDYDDYHHQDETCDLDDNYDDDHYKIVPAFNQDRPRYFRGSQFEDKHKDDHRDNGHVDFHKDQHKDREVDFHNDHHEKDCDVECHDGCREDCKSITKKEVVKTTTKFGLSPAFIVKLKEAQMRAENAKENLSSILYDLEAAQDQCDAADRTLTRLLKRVTRRH